jgi:hypothetical protein
MPVQPETVVTNPDTSKSTSDEIDRRVNNSERVTRAIIEGQQRAVDVFQADLTRVPTQLDRAIDALSDLEEARRQGDVAVLTQRMDGNARAIELFQKFTDKQPDFVRDQVAHLRDLHEAKIDGMAASLTEKIKSLSDVTTQQFKSIADQFAEKDKAVSVGLSAQKESQTAMQAATAAATTKMEDNFTKLLDQGRELLTEVRRNTDVQINDIKSRLDKGEGRSAAADPETARVLLMLTEKIGTLTNRDERHSGERAAMSDNKSTTISFAAIMIAAVAAMAAVGTMLTHMH